MYELKSRVFFQRISESLASSMLCRLLIARERGFEGKVNMLMAAKCLQTAYSNGYEVDKHLGQFGQ